jgi:hypothetical protein
VVIERLAANVGVATVLRQYFWTGYGMGGEISRNQVWTRVGHMLILKTGIYFSSPADSCHIVCLLEMCLPIGVPFPHTQQMTTTILISSIPSRGIDVSNYQFHKRNQDTDSVRSMPGVLRSLKKFGLFVFNPSILRHSVI